MKNANLYFFALATFLFFSCNQNNNSDASQDDAMAVDTVAKEEWFIAADKLDSAFLDLKTYSNEKVKGKLVFTFEEKDKNDGQIEGEFRGDTLFVDYTFMIGPTKTVYKNPLAFLKKDGKLILGIGQIETNLGRSYFIKGTPIDFDKGRFVFLPADCQP